MQQMLPRKVNATPGARVSTGERAVFDDKPTVTLTGSPMMRQA